MVVMKSLWLIGLTINILYAPTNNDIPVKILSHPYVLANRSVLCNSGIKVDNHYLLESLAACDNRHSNLTMYFTINIGLVKLSRGIS